MIIILNNKSNLMKQEYLIYQEELSKIKTTHQLILCPSSCYLSLYKLNNIELGCQDCSIYETGSHTGEIAASQLKSLGTKYCLVGHSERRLEKKETVIEINKKIEKLLANDITPILCIGETEEAKESEARDSIIKRDIKEIFNNIENKNLDKIIIAYEPVWSIGTGKIPTIKDLCEIFKKIRSLCPNNKLLYGGSINEENINSIKRVEEIDGYLLGSLSLDIKRLKIFIQNL